MYVVATAGHVDHGKSTLVRALTGSDPDRLEEERRRGLTIALGYCWTDLPCVGEVAFVDVPGHQRFISTMLAGVGPVPAVLFVVAADDAWMPQAAEHLAALDAFGVEHAVVAITRADLADPARAAERATAELARTSLRGAPVIPVSAMTGSGLPELRNALAEMTATLAAPAPDADVRLWVDRRFTVRGAGTIVTGTLPSGTIAIGDRLAVGNELVRVRGIEALGHPREHITGVARVALNLGSKTPDALHRDSVLVTPNAWLWTTSVDVVLQPSLPARDHPATGSLPPRADAPPPGRAGLVLHVGAVAETVHYRPLGDTHGRVLLRRPLPLRVGDRAILREPGSRRLWGITVVDPVPPPLGRRGSATRRAADLSDADGRPDLAAEVRRRGVVQASLLHRIGIDPGLADQAGGSAASAPGRMRTGGGAADVVRVGDWLVDGELAAVLRSRLAEVVRSHAAEHPLDPGLPLHAAAGALDLPAAELVAALVAEPLRLSAGQVFSGTDSSLPAELLEAIAEVVDELRDRPFHAPDVDRLQAAGLDRRSLAAAEKAGLLLRVADNVVLLPGAEQAAARRLGEIPQPFTTSEARRCLDSSRRVVIPLLERLDRLALTRRLPDDRRLVTPD